MEENNSFSVQKILNDWLKKEMSERKDHKSEYFYASSLGSCKRKQIWKRINEPETNPINERTLRIFSVGNIFHEWIQKKLDEAGVLLKKEETVVNEEYNYKGRYDALIEKNEKKLLYDFKTQHSQSFHYLEKQGLDESKKLQVVSYVVMGNLPVDECRVLMISKDDLCLMEFPVKVKEYKDKVINELKELNQYFKNKIIPDQIPEIHENKPNWQCKFCSYLNKCRGENWLTQINKKIKVKVKITK